MDSSTPSTSKGSPPKQRKWLSLGHLGLSEKQCIINMYKQLLNEKPKSKIVDVISKISQAAGVAKYTTYRVLKEYRSNGAISSPKNIGGRPPLLKTLDERFNNSVRRIVHDFFFKNELPTLDKIFQSLKKRSDLPQISRSSLYTFLKQINFRYLKRNRQSVLIERDDICRWRIRYLRSIKQYRKEKRPIFYLDETWINEGHTKGKTWVDLNITTRREAFNEGLSTGLRSPSGKGRRLIILHAGSEKGFVENGLLVFEGKKTGDYHEEMNSQVFERWFSTFLTTLPNDAVIVIDNAPYHSRKVEKVPSSSSRKTEMQEWLQSKNIAFDLNIKRCELLHLIRLNKDKHNLYVVDEMAKESNKVVLRLPPYHCEFNPKELIWAQIKNEVAAENTTFKFADVKSLFLQAIEHVTPTNWQKCIEHVMKEEEKMSALDGIMDNMIEPLIITANTGSSDEMESFESESSDVD